MKHPFKKLTALLCAALVLASLLPVQAVAAAEEPTLYGVLQRGNPLYPASCADDFTYITSDAPALLMDSNVFSQDLPSFDSAEEAGAYVRTAFKARDEGVVFFYTDIPESGPFLDLTEKEADPSTFTDEEWYDYKTEEKILLQRSFGKYLDSLLTEVLDDAFRHDPADPTGGDYLRYQYGTHLAEAAYRGDLFALEIHFTYYTTAEQETDVDEAAAALIDHLTLTGKTDYERLTAIYSWICRNVTYDSINLNDGDYTLKYTAYAALVNKTAVCQGYAVLLYRLALMAGIEARVVTGTANNGGHAWNIVKLDGKWYHVDATWDATWGAAQERWQYYLKPSLADHTLDGDGQAVVNQYPMANAAYTYTKPASGDLNGGGVTVTDVQLLYTYLTTGSTGESTLSPNDFFAAADVNGDKSVDVYDLQWLYEYVSTKRT